MTRTALIATVIALVFGMSFGWMLKAQLIKPCPDTRPDLATQLRIAELEAELAKSRMVSDTLEKNLTPVVTNERYERTLRLAPSLDYARRRDSIVAE